MNTKIPWLGYFVSSIKLAIIFLRKFREISSQDLIVTFPDTTQVKFNAMTVPPVLLVGIPVIQNPGSYHHKASKKKSTH